MPSLGTVLKDRAKCEPSLGPIMDRYASLENRIGKMRQGRKDEMPPLKSCVFSAQRAVYLGLNQEPRYSPKNISRALNNIELGIETIMGAELERPNDIWLFARMRPADFQNPEAIWLFDVLYNGENVARMGLNFHYEDEKSITSIATIQGNKDSQMLVGLRDALKSQNTYWPIEAVGMILEYLAGKVDIVRGISSLAHPEKDKESFDKRSTFGQYDRTFNKLGFSKTNEAGSVAYYEKVLS